MAHSQHLRATVTNQDFMYEGNKGTLKSRNVSWLLIQNILSFLLLKKQITTYTNIILLVILCVCETWSVALRSNIIWEFSRIGYWGKYFDRRGRKKEVTRENYTLRSVTILIPSQIFRVITSTRKGWVVHMACIREKRNKHSFLVGNLNKIIPWESLCKYKDNIKVDFKDMLMT